jgi:hypothetical protein
MDYAGLLRANPIALLNVYVVTTSLYASCELAPVDRRH